jgi:hypothetical protein
VTKKQQIDVLIKDDQESDREIVIEQCHAGDHIDWDAEKLLAIAFPTCQEGTGKGTYQLS